MNRREFMKQAGTLAVVAAGGDVLFFLGGCSGSGSNSISVQASIRTSSSNEELSVVNPPSQIILEFSEPMDLNTVKGMVNLYAVKAGGILSNTDPGLQVTSDPQNARRLIISTTNNQNLSGGEKYQLTVSKDIRSTKGHTLPRDYVGYFATDYNLGSGASAITELGNNRIIIVVISDTHLGDARSINDGYAWLNKNKDKLKNFLNLVRNKPNVAELVIAGDMFDEWIAPMQTDTLGGLSLPDFVDSIAAANSEIITAIKNIIQDGNIKLTYVPGNHDMLVSQADIQRIFPGISQARDAEGLGAYTPSAHSEIIIEHGHRYDFFNAPDTISNRDITKTESILSPGFFVSKIACSSDVEKNLPVTFYRQQTTDYFRSLGAQSGNYYLSYWAAWQIIMSKKPVKEAWVEKVIKTGIDGFTDTYAINDLIPGYDEKNGPLNVTLYKGIVDKWYDRQKINNVPVQILPELAIAAGAINWVLDDLTLVEYFLNTSSNKRIVVFGHTHEPKIWSVLNHNARWSIYVNSGTWVDTADPSCSFVTIIPKKDNSAVTETVTVWQYIDDSNIKKIDSRAIEI